jgi:RNA 3'-terminal phosphate cyclase
LYLNDINLTVTRKRREHHHLFVSDHRDCEAVCNEIAESLVEFLNQRFSMDESLVSLLVPFVHFDVKHVNMREIYATVCPDLDLAAIFCEFAELAESNTVVTSMKLHDLVKYL